MSLYLILHKVRGEPAFDIAQMCEDMGTESDPEPWWIIPTSGHRAYPWGWWKMEELRSADGYHPPILSECNTLSGLMDLPDHYQTTSAPKAKGILSNIISALTAPKEKIRRI